MLRASLALFACSSLAPARSQNDKICFVPFQSTGGGRLLDRLRGGTRLETEETYFDTFLFINT
jgi:hypothetical protein